MGDPYGIQLLSLVDPNLNALTEFHKVRGSSTERNIVDKAQVVSQTGTAASGGTATVSVSANFVDTLTKLQGYIPAILGIMALNALVLLVLAAVGIVYMCRRRTRARARKTPGRSTPMPLTRPSSYVAHRDLHQDPGPDALGAYQPVSMALTEDTFVPPSPAFSKPGFDSVVRAGDRPKSVA